jgi:hypothetical protein
MIAHHVPVESVPWIGGFCECTVTTSGKWHIGLGFIREGIAESIRALHDDGLPRNKLSSNGHAF